jgi:RNA polymerase sigma-70 factor (ECF subfamily)
MIPTGEQSDLQLVFRVAAGDERALGDLHDRHGPVVYSLANAILTDAADAEEVTADVFLQVWRSASTFDPTRARVAAWLTVLARSRALDRLRARQRRARTLEAAAAVAPDGLGLSISPLVSPAVGVEGRDVADRVAGVVASLPDPQRRCIELAYFQGLTHSEIATALGEPLGTVKTRIRAAMDKLRTALQAYVTVE